MQQIEGALPIKGEIVEFRTLLSTRKTKDVVGFREGHEWRRYVT